MIKLKDTAVLFSYWTGSACKVNRAERMKEQKYERKKENNCYPHLADIEEGMC